ncbi:Distinct helicase family with a unique C-terminal domain including a metal-binding cysteine cluster [Pyrobaculum oguniense TE7]|uniref:Distinct helicase family with a unique C-terminal domain including a metal-binding cysteine cluster n=1 Tax=Pyrobaculum oguniense (strain DSM 13380 / JCM 10595 / TE7) TaxID=698757 RepID=H6Q773_PYROT|nr:Distinct helicase family with a unique C-terminal domain including a metal-binding cysteine cluster [Pyrobaculum oguniense TE7]
MLATLSVHSLIRVAEKVADALRSRHHAEKPHISVVAISRDFFDMVLRDILCGTRIEIEEDDEEDVEEVEESLTSIPPPWAFGVSAEAECLENGSISAEFRFVIRRGVRGSPETRGDTVTDPDPNEYADLVLKADVSVSGGLVVSGALVTADGNQICKCQASGVDEPVWLLFFPKRFWNAVNTATQKMEGALKVMGLRLDPSTRSVDRAKYSICLCDDHRLEAVIHDRHLNELGRLYYAMGLYASYTGERLNVYLVNLSGYVTSTDRSVVNDMCKRRGLVYTWSDEQSRWALGYLMETHGRLQFNNGCRHRARWTEHGIVGAYPLNAVVKTDQEGNYIELRDYVVEEEIVRRPVKDNVSISQVLTSEALKIAENVGGCDKAREILSALAEAVTAYIGSEYLYKFQREALIEILKNITANDRRAVVITAPTAAGKTLAFLLPIIVDFAVLACSRKAQPRGVLYYLLYPTKALANDQLDEVANILYAIWRRLPQEIRRLVIPTFGLLHGDIKDEYYETPISYTTAEGKTAYVSVECDRAPEYRPPNCHVECNECPPDFVDFLKEHYRPNRFAIYSDPPNILITDEDMINRILSLRPYKYPAGEGRGYVPVYELHLFGGGYKRCKVCGFVYPPAYEGYRGKNLCKICQSGELEGLTAEPPRIFVLDEAHQLHGSFGSQVRYLFATLEDHIRRECKEHIVKYVISSATIAQPKSFVSRLLNLGEDKIVEISASLSEREEERVNRVHLVLMPRSYTRDNTLSMALYYLFSVWPDAKGIVFTNTLSENNDVTNALRDRLANLNVEVKSHSTDYNRYDLYDDEDRVKIEQWFKYARERAVLVATPTMELGVDIGDVNFVALYGLPETLSSYIQRIGRAGRKRDALVLTVANPFNRYDYFFYENYKLLTDSGLRAKAQLREVIPISVTNREAWTRGVLRHLLYIFKHYCVKDRMCARQYINDEYNIDDVYLMIKRVTLNDFPDIFRQHSFEQALDRILKDLLERTNPERGPVRRTLRYDDVAQHLARVTGRTEILSLLRNLRGFDLQIMLEFPTGEVRSRDAYIFTRKGATGQIVSFRGRYYVINSYRNEVSSRLSEFLGDKGP